CLLVIVHRVRSSFYVCNARPTTEIYTLSLHDALPIYCPRRPASESPKPAPRHAVAAAACRGAQCPAAAAVPPGRHLRAAGSPRRSEEHTSELQSRFDLVCRLLLEKKNSNGSKTRVPDA